MGKMTHLHVVAVGLLVVLALVPIWWAYGALTPEDDHGGTDMTGMGMDASGMSGMDMEQGAASQAFFIHAQAYAAANERPDGSVHAVTDAAVPVAVFQFGFSPRVLHMETGQTYTLEFLAKDVIHGLSLQMGLAGSRNAVLTPGMMTTLEVMPTQPGEYLFLCNEYCGVGHQFMSGKIVVEGPPVQPGEDHPAPPANQQPQHSGGH